MLQEIFGRIRLVERNGGLYAEFEAPLERLLLAAGGALLGRVAGVRFVKWKHCQIKDVPCASRVSLRGVERRINSLAQKNNISIA